MKNLGVKAPQMSYEWSSSNYIAKVNGSRGDPALFAFLLCLGTPKRLMWDVVSTNQLH